MFGAAPAADGDRPIGYTESAVKLERKRVEVVYGPTRFSFEWTKTTPPQVLLQKLSRTLDKTVDPKLLVLTDSDGDECDLCDAIENNAVLTAKFLDFHHQGWFSVSPSVLAEVVGVKRPVVNRHEVRRFWHVVGAMLSGGDTLISRDVWRGGRQYHGVAVVQISRDERRGV